MIEELRERFRTRFIDTARGRIRRCLELMSDAGGATPLMEELHSLAGEAAMLGLKEISDVARGGELSARDLVDGDSSAKLRCVRAVRTLSQQIEAFAAEKPEVLSDDDDGAGDSSREHRVLLIDDSSLAGEHLADALDGEDIKAELATDRATALARVAGFAPQVVLSDVNMPGIDLGELCRALRQAATTPITILLLSGMEDEQLAPLAKKVGADGYVSKRRGTDYVLEHLQRVLQEIDK